MSRILVVDDMAAIREPIAATLKAAGYEVETAAGGHQALAAVRQRRPDLVLLDVSMPEMDGLTVLRAMRSNEATAAIPVILLTAESEKKSVLAAVELGARDYILKSSFSLPQLLARIRKHLPPVASPAA
jgi:DNA-binding response OmpR family regulator